MRCVIGFMALRVPCPRHTKSKAVCCLLHKCPMLTWVKTNRYLHCNFEGVQHVWHVHVDCHLMPLLWITSRSPQPMYSSVDTSDA